MPLALKWAPQIKEVPGQTNTEKLIKVSNTNDDVINSTKVYIYIYPYLQKEDSSRRVQTTK